MDSSQEQRQGLLSPPVLSISTSTFTTTAASLPNAPHCDPNTVVSESTVNSAVQTGPILESSPSLISPSLNANSISKATVHAKTAVNVDVNGHTNPEANTNTKPEEGEDDLLEYNVFVLDATIDDLRREVPYLMMRMCGPGVPGGTSVDSTEDKTKVVAKAKADVKANAGLTKAKTEPSISISKSTSISTSTMSMSANDVSSHMQRDALFDVGAHTDGPDGHLIEEGIVEREERERARKKRGGSGMDLDVVDDMDMDMNMNESGVGVNMGAKEEEEEDDTLLPNTVDFALREKEEMRDLTKASEIISLHPETSISMTSAPSSPVSSPKPGSAHTPIPTSSSTIDPSSSVPNPETLETKPVWDPLVGQVYLGNSGDVPLAPDVPSHFRHAASLVRDTTLNGNPCAGLAEYFSSCDDEVDRDLDEEIGSSQPLPADDLFNYHATNDPNHGFGYDIAVECHELAPFPSTAHLRAADEHLGTLDLLWKERWERGWRAREEKIVKKRKATAGGGVGEEEYDSMTWRNPPRAPPRPPPHASAVIHLPFPSSPSNNQTTMVSLMPVIRFLEKWMKPLPVPLALPAVPMASTSGTATPEMKNLKLVGNGDAVPQTPPPVATATPTASARRWSSVTALMPSFPSFPLGGSSSASTPAALSSNSEANAANSTSTTVSTPPFPPHPARNRSYTTPHPSGGGGAHQAPRYILKPPQPQPTRTRPLKILLYSSDGYTESSVPALCLLMAIKSLSLPEAYLELQVVKRRSFFVYQADLGILRRVEARLKEEKERERERERGRERERERLNGSFLMGGAGIGGVGSVNANGKRTASVRGGYWSGTNSSTGLGGSGTSYPGGTVAVTPPPPVTTRPSQKSSFTGRPAAKSVSFAQAPHPMMVPSLQQQHEQHEQHEHEHYLQNQPTVPTVIPTQPYPIPGTSYLGQAAFSGGFPTQSNVPHIPLQLPYHQPGASYSEGSGCQEGHQVVKGRPRANTSPWLPSLFGGDHQSWFNDPRFDGSFPSRVLPFLYLGNLCVFLVYFVFLS